MHYHIQPSYETLSFPEFLLGSSVLISQGLLGLTTFPNPDFSLSHSLDVETKYALSGRLTLPLEPPPPYVVACTQVAVLYANLTQMTGCFLILLHSSLGSC